MRQKRKNGTPDMLPLQLCTLSGTFEGARAVIRQIPMGTISTFQQLGRRLQQIARNKDELRELFIALDRLDKESMMLGATTLVKPNDHPLFVRERFNGDQTR